jgi:hypothetical protein
MLNKFIVTSVKTAVRLVSDDGSCTMERPLSFICLTEIGTCKRSTVNESGLLEDCPLEFPVDVESPSFEYVWFELAYLADG